MKAPKNPNLSLKLRPSLKSWLKVYCFKEEISMTKIITRLLEQFKSEQS